MSHTERTHAFTAKARPTAAARQSRLEARRAQALRAQQDSRSAQLQALRAALADDARVDEEDAAETSSASLAAASSATAAASAAPSPSASASTRRGPRHGRSESAAHRAMRVRYASQLLQPNWLDVLPADAYASSMLLSRPEGARCLVVARRGRTWSRSKHGSLLHAHFSSPLPHGGARAAGGQSVAVAGATGGDDAAPSTVLDCIFSETAKAFIVLDCLIFNNFVLSESSSEFRLYWLWQKLAELAGPNAFSSVLSASAPGLPLRMLSLPATAHSPFAFHFLEPLPCRSDALRAIYPLDPRLSAVGARQDGYGLLHRELQYAGGETDLYLLFKDAHCSAFLIDEPSTSTQQGDSTALAPMLVTLRLGEQRQLQCEGGQVAGVLDEFTYQTSSLRVGDLLVCSVAGIDEEVPEPINATSEMQAEPVLQWRQLTFVKKASPARVHADTQSRVLHQWHARTGQLPSMEQICAQLEQQQAQAQLSSQQPVPVTAGVSSVPPVASLIAPCADSSAAMES